MSPPIRCTGIGRTLRGTVLNLSCGCALELGVESIIMMESVILTIANAIPDHSCPRSAAALLADPDGRQRLRP
jgi:hypothetical protein